MSSSCQTRGQPGSAGRARGIRRRAPSAGGGACGLRRAARRRTRQWTRGRVIRVEERRSVPHGAVRATSVRRSVTATATSPRRPLKGRHALAEALLAEALRTLSIQRGFSDAEDEGGAGLEAEWSLRSGLARRARSWPGRDPHPGRGVRRLPQRRGDEGRRISRGSRSRAYLATRSPAGSMRSAQTSAAWKPGDRVGVGWHGGHCFVCDPVPQGRLHQLREGPDHRHHPGRRIRRVRGRPVRSGGAHPGRSRRGRGRPAPVRRRHHLQLAAQQRGEARATPSPCKASAAWATSRIQYAARMGFRTVALSHGSEKEALARELGAHEYVDTQKVDAAEGLRRLGGADLVLATAPHSAAIASTINGLKVARQAAHRRGGLRADSRYRRSRSSPARRSPAGRAAARSTPRRR